MTEDEKRRQKADLLLEYAETEQHLAHLREKATRQSQRIEAVSQWLSKAGDSRNSGMDKVYVSSGGGAVFNVPTDPEIPIAMDFAEAAKLVEEIKAAIRKLAELAQRKAALGLR
jgi:hypothetical protein